MGALNPEILTWARQTAGLSLEQGAHAIGLKSAHGKTGSERLAEIELGVQPPSRNTLEKMAKKYRRSLLVFYLSAPPRIGDRGQDFRRIKGGQALEEDPDLDALIRNIKGRQNLVKSVLEDLEAEPVPFVASIQLSVPAESLARQISSTIGFALAEFRATKSVDEAFSYLRSRIEAAGVFVLLAGDLGSHHSRISTESFRGFAIADSLAPFVVVNDRDAPSARSFTALHELVHIWLGTTGISGGAMISANRQEQYCNDVAAECLLPASELKRLPRTDFTYALSHVSNLADERKVSRSMVAYRHFRLGHLSRGVWDQLSSHFAQEWAERRARNPAKQKEGGPSYYVVRRHRLGQALLDTVRRSLGEGAITYTKAGRVLGVKPNNVDELLRAGRNA